AIRLPCRRPQRSPQQHHRQQAHPRPHFSRNDRNGPRPLHSWSWQDTLTPTPSPSQIGREPRQRTVSAAIHWHFLTYSPREPQTHFMPHTYIQFDFAKDEEKVQQARHKLEGWKQAYRLDKKLLFKFERIAAAPADDAAKTGDSEKPGKSKGKSKDKPESPAAAPAETVKLLVRLDFSNHEKLSGQRWLQRIPSEEPFQGASPTVVKPADPHFA